MAQSGEVEVSMGGHTYKGEWRIEGSVLHLTSDLGAKSAPIGALTEQPGILARTLLRGVVIDTGGYPD
jgi:hypothetical protein